MQSSRFCPRSRTSFGAPTVLLAKLLNNSIVLNRSPLHGIRSNLELIRTVTTASTLRTISALPAHPAMVDSSRADLRPKSHCWMLPRYVRYL